jgi:hypothetical protein
MISSLMQLAQIACITNCPWICRILFLLIGKCLQQADFFFVFVFAKLSQVHKIRVGWLFWVATWFEENTVYKDCYVAVTHIECYKLYVQSCIHISLLIRNADMIFSTWVFSRSYESIDSYEWPAVPDSEMGMLQQFIRCLNGAIQLCIWMSE